MSHLNFILNAAKINGELQQFSISNKEIKRPVDKDDGRD